MPEAQERPPRLFSTAKLGALADLYRGEVYRSTIWRTRLDTSTNWSVVTLGVALSISFSSPAASPLSVSQLLERAAVGPLPGELALSIGAFYCLARSASAVWSWHRGTARRSGRGELGGMG